MLDYLYITKLEIRISYYVPPYAELEIPHFILWMISGKVLPGLSLWEAPPDLEGTSLGAQQTGAINPRAKQTTELDVITNAMITEQIGATYKHYTYCK